MSTMLRPAEIAVIWETALNTTAANKYAAEEVTDKIVFNVTADYQLYERLQKGEYALDDYQNVTPVIIARVDHYEYPADYLRYEETYEIKVYGYADQLVSLEKILKEFTVEENTTNKSVVISPFRITKEQEDISFGIELDAMDGSLNKRIEGTGEFTWTFLDGVMTSYDIIIKIDNEEMPYLAFGFNDSIGSIQNETIDAAGQTSSILANSAYEMILTLPYISTSPVIKALYKEFYEGTYNKLHTLTYYDSALNETFTFDVRVGSKMFADERPRILDFTITLIRVYEQVTITIDGVHVPVLNFEIQSGAQLSTSTKINSSDAKSVNMGENFQMLLTIPIDDSTNTKIDELLQQVINYDFSTPHQVELTKGSINKIYDVLIYNGNYSFEGNPQGIINLTLVEQDDSV